MFISGAVNSTTDIYRVYILIIHNNIGDINQCDTIKYDTYQCDTRQGDTIQCDTNKGDIIQYDINQYDTNHCDTISEYKYIYNVIIAI